MKPVDLILSVLLLTGLAVFIFYIFKGKVENDDYFESNYSIDRKSTRLNSSHL